jgi:RNA polymerase sigma-70 factor (ECF subfamily)
VARDRQAQRQLYSQLLPYLSAVAERYLHDTSYSGDVLQESFIKIFKNIEKYDAARAPFAQWAAKIVIYNAINYNRRVVSPPFLEIQSAGNDLLVNQPVAQDITDEYLLSVLKKMPKDYFEVFNLYIIDEYKHEEIAQILGITEALSRQRLSRAKAWLKQTFGYKDQLIYGVYNLTHIFN